MAIATSSFSDGFPQDPLSAINQSYFLSDSEKQEWREWIQTATDEQKLELVEILHSMWEDNQKSAVPDSFSNSSPTPPPAFAATPTPAPPTPPQPIPPAPNPPLPTPAKPLESAPAIPSFEEFLAQQNQLPANTTAIPISNPNFSEPASNNPTPAVAPLPPLPDFSSTPPAPAISTITEPNDPFATKTSASPSLSDNPNALSGTDTFATNDPFSSQFSSQSTPAKPITPVPTNPVASSQPSKANVANQSDDTDELTLRSLGQSQNYSPNPILNNQKTADQFNFNNTPPRPSRTPNPNLSDKLEDLENIYQDYVQTFEGNQKKFMDLLKGVTQNLGSYQTLRDDLDIVREKSLAINAQVVEQNKKIQEIENVTLSAGKTSLQDQIDAIQIQLESLHKEFRTFQINTKSFINKISTEVAGYKADTYGSEKVEEQVSLLKNQISKLEKAWHSNQAKSSQTTKHNQFSTDSQTISDSEDSHTITKTSQVDLRGVL
jgi:hypothetical protein